VSVVCVYKEEAEVEKMRNDAEMLMISFLPKSNFNLLFEPKKQQYASVQVVNYANYIKPNILILGYTGTHG
jgi:hypothetical protein